MKNRYIALAESILNDDHGISEESMDHLREILLEESDKDDTIRHDVDRLLFSVKAVEGRYYLPLLFKETE